VDDPQICKPELLQCVFPTVGCMHPMLIVADENMPCVREWFAALGEVRALSGRSLDAASVRDADILLVRSVTRVDRALLQGSSVRFVGTATIGIDHLDTDYLRAHGIAYANAPGCNANAVVDYVLSCFAATDGLLERLLAGGTVGIIGLGNVGSRLCRRLQALGLRCIGYDPYLRSDSMLPLTALEEVLGADVICCHTPLTRDGGHSTWHLLNKNNLARLRQDVVLLNAGRGPVIDNSYLPQWLSTRPDARLILDVWEREPAIERDLLRRIHIATPHIAGYSLDGKLAGTRMVLEACCAFLQFPLPPQMPLDFAAPTIAVKSELVGVELMRAAIRGVYDVRADDARMRAVIGDCETAQIAERFDNLRKNYPERREFGAVRISNWPTLALEQQRLLRQLGFVGEMS